MNSKRITRILSDLKHGDLIDTCLTESECIVIIEQNKALEKEIEERMETEASLTEWVFDVEEQNEALEREKAEQLAIVSGVGDIICGNGVNHKQDIPVDTCVYCKINRLKVVIHYCQIGKNGGLLPNGWTQCGELHCGKTTANAEKVTCKKCLKSLPPSSGKEEVCEGKVVLYGSVDENGTWHHNPILTMSRLEQMEANGMVFTPEEENHG